MEEKIKKIMNVLDITPYELAKFLNISPDVPYRFFYKKKYIRRNIEPYLGRIIKFLIKSYEKKVAELKSIENEIEELKKEVQND